jgi:ubiquinone/menaquinone biosynthesis C-methylase UbiE
MSKSTIHNDEVINQFSLQAESYNRLTGSMNSDRSAALRDLVSVSPDDLLLDVCCGPGLLTMDLAPYVRRATGVDLTPAMLDRARATQKAVGLVNVSWMQGDACRLPFEDGSFSLVVCSAAFHHLEHPKLALREMVRVCRSEGRIVVRDVTPAPEHVAAYDRMEKMRDPSHIHALTADELLSLGVGLMVGEPRIRKSTAADLSLNAILATSFPETCTTEQIQALFVKDAISGQNSLGFSARMVDGEVRVSYTMSTMLWSRL